MSFTRFRVPLALVSLVPLMAASTRAPLDLQPESRLTIYGTSTVRSFQCQASSFDAKIESAGNGACSPTVPRSASSADGRPAPEPNTR